MKVPYQDWVYESYEDNGRWGFKVEPTSDFKFNRKTFFKFYALSDNSIDALTRCYIYASHPNQFNDSFDCHSQILNFKNSNDSILECIYGHLYNDFLNFYGGKEALMAYTSEHFKEVIYRHIGLISLAERNTNAHLWHAYSQDSQGFCVEFDIAKFPFKCYGPNPIQYVDKLIPHDVNNNVQAALFIQTNVKTSDWQSEQEWRLIVSNPEGLDFNSWGTDGSLHREYNRGDEHDRKMRYPLDAIKSITLGERFFRSPNIRWYPVSDDEFECVFLDRNKEELRCKVLDFLINKPIRLYLIDDIMGELMPIPIGITKLQSQVYRIILKKENQV